MDLDVLFFDGEKVVSIGEKNAPKACHVVVICSDPGGSFDIYESI